MKAICRILSIISLGLNFALVWAIVNGGLSGILAIVIFACAILINMMVSFFSGYIDGADSKCKHKNKGYKKNEAYKKNEDKDIFDKFGV